MRHTAPCRAPLAARSLARRSATARPKPSPPAVGVPREPPAGPRPLRRPRRPTGRRPAAGAQDGPQRDEQIPVQEVAQDLALPFGQDGAIQAHPRARLLQAVGTAARPDHVQRQVVRAVDRPGQVLKLCGQPLCVLGAQQLKRVRHRERHGPAGDGRGHRVPRRLRRPAEAVVDQPESGHHEACLVRLDTTERVLCALARAQASTLTPPLTRTGRPRAEVICALRGGRPGATGTWIAANASTRVRSAYSAD